jgi:hypothetical protein
MSLFEPSKPEGKPPAHSKTFEREIGLLAVLGPALVLIGLIYLLSFLGD